MFEARLWKQISLVIRVSETDNFEEKADIRLHELLLWLNSSLKSQLSLSKPKRRTEPDDCRKQLQHHNTLIHEAAKLLAIPLSRSILPLQLAWLKTK